MRNMIALSALGLSLALGGSALADDRSSDRRGDEVRAESRSVGDRGEHGRRHDGDRSKSNHKRHEARSPSDDSARGVDGKSQGRHGKHSDERHADRRS